MFFYPSRSLFDMHQKGEFFPTASPVGTLRFLGLPPSFPPSNLCRLFLCSFSFLLHSAVVVGVRDLTFSPPPLPLFLDPPLPMSPQLPNSFFCPPAPIERSTLVTIIYLSSYTYFLGVILPFLNWPPLSFGWYLCFFSLSGSLHYFFFSVCKSVLDFPGPTYLTIPVNQLG